MNKIIFVLGMHRSFTSVFTNYLNDIGISMGTFENVVSKEENPEGFFENLSISAFNDKLLNRLNARWDSIIDLSNIDYNINDFDDLFTEARRLIEAQLAGGDTILVKDPRMCLVLPFWLKVI